MYTQQCLAYQYRFALEMESKGRGKLKALSLTFTVEKRGWSTRGVRLNFKKQFKSKKLKRNYGPWEAENQINFFFSLDDINLFDMYDDDVVERIRLWNLLFPANNFMSVTGEIAFHVKLDWSFVRTHHPPSCFLFEVHTWKFDSIFFLSGDFHQNWIVKFITNFYLIKSNPEIFLNPH